jgi:predicted HTH transcriptional regulator
MPRTFAAAKADVDARRVVENHYIEIKRTYPRTDGGTRVVGKDLAALGLDAGVLIIGVDEDDLGRAVEINPVPLAGFAERIDQVALHRCDPSMTVRITPVHAPTDETTGILIIEVPAHPLAPIMVEGRYYGRGERGVRQLADAEVVRLHLARTVEAER